ncbi:MAG TPA: methylmalonyl-CoA mutase [Candidatus Poseidoniales archaeon]|jgi:methylmalonyl-CoA mutase N-terminal domain/subunit|nr:MAG: methylmalonyl-CoA mutase [Euryarchaeota archaeon]HIF46325.1 methylmalonyl-CoA mutase [Candidatus Poseidoniales archaeon]HIL65540.1 methylmalonyl-CoA mutase [Candidatus Poseidoniales archaeon]
MASQDEENWQTLGGIDIAKTYGPDEAGKPPYTRGIHNTMYRSRRWTMRQYAGFSSAESTNERFKLLLDRGQKGLSVAFDLPTQLGMDADNEMSEGEVGKVGVSISCLDDMRILLKGIPLDKVSTSMTINAPAMILLAMYVAIAEEQGVGQESVRGTIQNDILKEYIARGTYVFPPKHSMRLITDIFEHCAENIPAWNTISISGYHIREAGSTAVQEIAFTLSNALAYVEAAVDKGLDIDTFGPRLSFFFNCHNDFFEEASKFRAARKLWHDLITERYNPKNPKSAMLRFHTQVAGVSLTAQQPLNNIARVTIQALAAVCGGTQSLHTNSYDEALGLPTEKSATVALRTQQIISEESGAANVVDPLGGSHYVEALTTEIYEQALKQIEQIEAMGGAMKAIEAGYQQREIHESAWDHLSKVEAGERLIIGLNHGVLDEDESPPVLKPDLTLEQNQKDKLAALRAKRDDNAVRLALNGIRSAATTEENLFPHVVKALQLDCTLGEIINAMKDEFGTWMAPSGF